MSKHALMAAARVDCVDELGTAIVHTCAQRLLAHGAADPQCEVILAAALAFAVTRVGRQPTFARVPELVRELLAVAKEHR